MRLRHPYALEDKSQPRAEPAERRTRGSPPSGSRAPGSMQEVLDYNRLINLREVGRGARKAVGSLHAPAIAVRGIERFRNPTLSIRRPASSEEKSGESMRLIDWTASLNTLTDRFGSTFV